VEHHCGESTVNRKLSALSAFYQHAARSGVDLGELLVTWQPAGRRGTAWKPFLHHIAKGQPQARRMVALKAARKLPRVLTVAEVQAILDACDRLRDRYEDLSRDRLAVADSVLKFLRLPQLDA